MATTTAALEAKPDQDEMTEAIHDLCNGLIDQRAAPKSVETDVQRLTASAHAEINALQVVVGTFKDEIAGRLQRAIENGDDAQSRLKQAVTKLEDKLKELKNADAEARHPAMSESGPTGIPGSGPPGSEVPEPAVTRPSADQKREAEDPLQFIAWSQQQVLEYSMATPLKVKGGGKGDGERTNLYEQKGSHKRCQKYSREVRACRRAGLQELRI